MNGIWLLPTRMRLDKLQKFLDAAIDKGTSTPGLILVERGELAAFAAEYRALRMPPGWVVVGTQSEGMADKFRELWPAYKDLDWMGMLCDDMQPVTHLWDRTMLSHLDGKNVVTCDVGEAAQPRFSVPVWSGALMRSVGYIYPPGLWHTYVDDMWELMGAQTGCWDVCMDVLCIHDHPFKVGAGNEADETHTVSYAHMEEDKRVFDDWLKGEFEAACARIRAMQNPGASTTGSGLVDKVRNWWYQPAHKQEHPEKGVTS